MELKPEWALIPAPFRFINNRDKEKINNLKYQKWDEDVIIKSRYYNIVTKTLVLTEEILMEPEFPWQIDNLLGKVGADLECLVLTGIWMRGYCNNVTEEAIRSVSKHCCYGRLRHLKFGHDWMCNWINGTVIFKEMRNNTLLCDNLRSIIFEKIMIEDVKTFQEFVNSCRNLNYLGIAGTCIHAKEYDEILLPITKNPSIKSIDVSKLVIFGFENDELYREPNEEFLVYNNFLRNVPQLENVKATSQRFIVPITNVLLNTNNKKKFKNFNIYGAIENRIDKRYINRANLVTENILIDYDIDHLCNRITNHWMPNVSARVSKNPDDIIMVLAHKEQSQIDKFVKTVHAKWKTFGYWHEVCNLWCNTLLIIEKEGIQLCQYLNEILDRKACAKHKCLLQCITIMFRAISTFSYTNTYTRETFNKLSTKIKQNHLSFQPIPKITRFISIHAKQYASQLTTLKLFFDTGFNIKDKKQLNKINKNILNQVYNEYFNSLKFNVMINSI